MQLTRKQRFLAKLFFCSSMLHCFALVYCFFLARGERFTQRIDLSLPRDIAFVYMPFQKKGHRGAAALKGLQGAASQGTQESSVVTTPQKSKTVMGAGRKGKKQKKQKKVAQVKKTQKKKAVVAEPEQKLKQIVDAPPKPLVTDAPVAEQVGEQAPIYIGQNELDNLEISEAVREEVVRVWQPPLGLALGRQCRVRLLIDWDGAVKEMDIEESSQVPAFDASVKLAVREMKFPKTVFGKELILPFGGV
jgi:outer membrane biosynthesis protein TonB